MENFLFYIGKSSVATAVFYLVFLLLFQKQKHFVFNRIYLPGSLALSFVIPLITFSSVQYLEATTTVNSDTFAYLSGETELMSSSFQWEWYHYLFGVYLLVSAMFLFHLVFGHFKAFSIIRRSRMQKLFECKVNITSKDVHPFSFFNRIVLSENTLTHPNLDIIVKHESIHVKEKHTLDILFAEALFLVQWFNPFAWLMKDAVKNNLEYKTDYEVAKSSDVQTYQMAMVTLSDKDGVAPFLTALNGSQLKNRIIMMKRKNKNKYAFWKQLAVIPVLAVLTMGLSNKEVKTEIVQKETGINVQLKEEDGNTTVNQITKEKSKVPEKMKINGMVTDESGKPISSVAVLVKGETTGTITNEAGAYSLELNKKPVTLEFRMLGYEKKEAEIEKSGELNIKLEKEEQHSLENISGKIEGFNASTDSSIGKTQEVKPLFLVDGIEVDGMDNLDPDNIESVSVLKDASATSLYGEKGKNGVVLVTTKASKAFETGDKTVIVDGKIYDGNINDIPTDEISSIAVLKGKEATSKLYGENAKNSAIIINTKTKYNSGVDDKKPLILLDGEEFKGTMDELRNENMASIDVVKGENAIKLYGLKAQNGAIIIKTNAYEGVLITPLQFRKFIAGEIKYPEDAQKGNIQGTVKLWADVGHDGKITSIYDKKPKGNIKNIEEIVVAGYKVSKDSGVLATADSEKKVSSLTRLLSDEVKRVISKCPPLKAPNLEGKMIELKVKFMLQ